MELVVINMKRTWLCVIILTIVFMIVSFLIHRLFVTYLNRESFDLYRIVTLNTGVSSCYTAIIEELGEPYQIEQLQVNSSQFYRFRYEGLNYYISAHRRVVRIDILCDSFRLRGRERLRIGSTRNDVEQAIMRRNWDSSVKRYNDTYLLTAFYKQASSLIIFSFNEMDTLIAISIRHMGVLRVFTD